MYANQAWEELWRNLWWYELCVFFEARGESSEGMIAVAHVIFNRVQKDNISIRKVVQKPWQFSWLNNDERQDMKFDEFDSMAKCKEAIATCFAERIQGKNLEDADHYFADYITPPDWAKSMTFIGKIGRHLFYRS